MYQRVQDENFGFRLVDDIDIAENTQTLLVLWNCSVEDKLHNLVSFCLFFSWTGAQEIIWIIWSQNFLYSGTAAALEIIWIIWSQIIAAPSCQTFHRPTLQLTSDPDDDGDDTDNAFQ